MGSKKLGIKQMEKQQRLRELKSEGGSGKKDAPVERRVGSVEAPDLRDAKFLREICGMKALTPYAVASKYNLHLGVARDLLEELERLGAIVPVAKSNRIAIWRPAAD